MSVIEAPVRQRGFSSDIRVVQPRQVINERFPGPRLFQSESLDPAFVVEAMLPNGLAVNTIQGAVHRVTHEPMRQLLQHGENVVVFNTANHTADGVQTRYDHEAVKKLSVQDGIIVPMAPWGDDSIMHMHMDADHPTMESLPSEVRRIHFAQQAKILEEFRSDGRPAYWGSNSSAACIEGKGLQSVLLQHSQAYRNGPELDWVTPDDIKRVRNQQVWDEGVSEYIGGRIVSQLQTDVLPGYWRGTAAAADNMGLTVDLPGFTPADFGNPDFADRLLLPLYGAIDTELGKVHRAVFTSDRRDILSFVQEERKKGRIDRERYEQFFTERPLEEAFAEIPNARVLTKLRGLSDEGVLRRPAGSTIGMQFRDEGALMTVSFGVLNVGLGPVESLGMQLSRPPEPLGHREMSSKVNTVYQRATNAMLAA